MNKFKNFFFLLITFFSFDSYSIEKILHVSYDPTVALYKEINQAFEEYYEKKYHQKIKILQSHGGSTKQARSVIEGIPADIVSLATEYDIDEIAKRNLIETNWRDKFPYNSNVFNSTIVFLVREDNPKLIFDWEDLTREDVEIIMPNPKTSGVAKLQYIAAWLYGMEKLNDEKKAQEFVKKIFNNIKILDSGSRGASMSFLNRQMGDVLVTWENEAHLAIKEMKQLSLKIIIPSSTLKIGLPVAVIPKTSSKKNNRLLAEEYLNFLYTPQAQIIAANNFFRPSDPEVFLQYQNIFPKINDLTYKKIGDLKLFYRDHFGEKGHLDQIFGEKENEKKK